MNAIDQPMISTPCLAITRCQAWVGVNTNEDDVKELLKENDVDGEVEYDDETQFIPLMFGSSAEDVVSLLSLFPKHTVEEAIKKYIESYSERKW